MESLTKTERNPPCSFYPSDEKPISNFLRSPFWQVMVVFLSLINDHFTRPNYAEKTGALLLFLAEMVTVLDVRKWLPQKRGSSK
jgi:hypothetical protein